jgi:hypothetical protein
MAAEDIEIPADEMTDFCNFMRENRIGDTAAQSNRAIERYEQQHGRITAEQLRENFSQILAECVQIETEIFNEIADSIRREWMGDLLEHANRRIDFPNFSNIAQQAIDILNRDQPIEHNLIDVVAILQRPNDGVSFSMRQSAKTRAGAAFQNFLQHFFTTLNFDYGRQESLRPGEILDLVFPSLTVLQNAQETAMIMECQTTLKDRFRLSLGKTNDLNRQSTKFIATLSGMNVITQSDHNDITQAKINEIHDNNWRLVCLRQVAEELVNNNQDTIISFEDFVNNEYPRISQRW